MMTYNIICFLSKFLNTDDIDDLGRKNKILNKYFLGAFPANINPYQNNKTCCWIWNIDGDDKSGRHWIAIWIDNNEMIFFDSYGLNIEQYKRHEWIEFARKNNLTLKYYNEIFHQNVFTKTCGMWSLIFLYQQCFNKITQKNKKKFKTHFRGYNKSRILQTLRNKEILLQTLKNEKKLFSLANSIFKTQLKNIYEQKCRKSKHNQRCTNFISIINKV